MSSVLFGRQTQQQLTTKENHIQSISDPLKVLEKEQIQIKAHEFKVFSYILCITVILWQKGHEFDSQLGQYRSFLLDKACMFSLYL